jgi:Flp pilus assembly protein TadD
VTSLDRFLSRRYVFFFLAIIVLLVYSPALKNGFTKWDDQEYVLNNTAVHSLSFSSVGNLFTNFLVISYHPLTLLSLAINYYFSGTSPTGYILTNILFHLFNCILLFILLDNLKLPKKISFFATLLFAIHPLSVEPVAWIAARKDVLFAFFFLMSLIFYIKYYNTKNTTAYLLSLFLFVCSCLSKAQAIPLCMTLFLIDYFFEGNFSFRQFKSKIPFILVALLFGLISFIAQGENTKVFAGNAFSFSQRLSFGAYNFLHYIVRVLLPVNLSAYYPYPHLFSKFYYVFIPLSLVLVIMSLYYFRKNKLIIFGLLFFTLNILPVLQIFPVGDAMMADRYTYIPGIGIFLIIVSGIVQLLEKLKPNKTITIIAISACMLILAKSSYARCHVWKNGFTLWTDVMRKQPKASISYTNRGNNYLEQGDTSSALVDYRKALAIDPSNSFASFNAASIFYSRGEYKLSLSLLKSMDTLFSQGTDVILLKAYNENKLGDFLSSQRDVTRYLIYKRTAEVYTLAGLNEIMLNDFSKAKKYLREALRLDSNYTEAYVKMGVAEIQSGDTTSSCQSWKRAFELGNADVVPYITQYCK